MDCSGRAGERLTALLLVMFELLETVIQPSM